MSDVPDATQVDPDGHRILFENDHVRVLEVRSPEGELIPMHTHPPRMVVPINGYRLKSIDADGNETVIDRRPGQARWTEHEQHAAEVLVGPTHVIEVEVKSAR